MSGIEHQTKFGHVRAATGHSDLFPTRPAAGGERHGLRHRRSAELFRQFFALAGSLFVLMSQISTLHTVAGSLTVSNSRHSRNRARTRFRGLADFHHQPVRIRLQTHREVGGSVGFKHHPAHCPSAAARFAPGPAANLLPRWFCQTALGKAAFREDRSKYAPDRQGDALHIALHPANR